VETVSAETFFRRIKDLAPTQGRRRTFATQLFDVSQPRVLHMYRRHNSLNDALDATMAEQ
jgi:hypothetical protein